MPPLAPKGFYVYALVDPRDDAVFYVGKGKGNRVSAHEAEARRGWTFQNPRKTERIREIWNAGQQVGRTILAEGLTEAAAFRKERLTIASFPKGALTNRARGQMRMTEHERAFISARIGLSMIYATVRSWIAGEPYTRRQAEMAVTIIAELKEDMAWCRDEVGRNGATI